MNYSEAIAFIESVSWKGSRPGLERISELCERLGSPEKKTKYVHVAGTNGKGSVSAILASVLSAAGYKTGLFTSPHLADICERAAIDGENITHKDFCRVCERIKKEADRMSDSPTEFELLTALAFEYFSEEKCDVAVLECGMGGRLDATNVIERPEVSVITNIALDHTAILGDTEVKIAYEKAGIIKGGAPVVVGAVSDEVKDFFVNICRERKSPLKFFDETDVSDMKLERAGLTLVYRGEEMFLPLCGAYQKTNVRTALAVIEELADAGYNITADDIKRGFSNVRWIGRFETLNTLPEIIFDGAHNPDGVNFTVETFRTLFPGKKAILVTGVLADKDYEYISAKLGSIASCVYTVTPDSTRALSGEEHAALYRALGLESAACDTVFKGISLAWDRALKTGETVLCAGSLYMYGDVLRAVNKKKNDL